jgi:hypothetical protein
MIVTTTDRTIVLHVVTTTTHTTVHAFTRSHRPGGAGRMKMATVHTRNVPGEALPDVLRAAAQMLETPVSERDVPLF